MADSLDDLTARLRRFARDRDWERFHTPKNLAMALSGEVGELLAELQWLTPDEAETLPAEAKSRVAAEMADVLIYLTRMADVMTIDLLEAADTKMRVNATRFPVGSKPSQGQTDQ